MNSNDARDSIGKANTTMSLMDWKIIMFDHKGVKITKVIWSLSILLLNDKTKKLVTKKNMKLKGLICVTQINL